MSSFGVAATVFLGSIAGIYQVYGDVASPEGLLVFGLLNGGYAWVVARVGAMAWDYFAATRRSHR